MLFLLFFVTAACSLGGLRAKQIARRAHVVHIYHDNYKQYNYKYEELNMCTHTCVRELYRACTEPVLATDGSQRDDFPIFVKCGDGTIVALKVVPESTCISVKRELGRRLNRCPASFRVVTLCGKELRGGRHISEYNIRSGSNLELSEFLLGGMMQEMTVPIANLSCPQSAAPAALPNADSVGANSSVAACHSVPPPGPDFVEAASTPGTQLDSQMLGGLADNTLVREEWQALVDFIVLQALPVTGNPDARIWQMEELSDWERTRCTLLAMGLDTGNDDPWQVVGLHRESGPSALDLESRRRTLQAFFKALAQLHYDSWGTAQCDQAEAARLKIDLAIDDCQIQLPGLFT